jgi:hypothetical protein
MDKQFPLNTSLLGEDLGKRYDFMNFEFVDKFRPCKLLVTSSPVHVTWKYLSPARFMMNVNSL